MKKILYVLLLFIVFIINACAPPIPSREDKNSAVEDPPKTPIVTNEKDYLRISWEKCTLDDVKGYNLYRNDNLVYSGNNISYNDYDVAEGTIYSYQVAIGSQNEENPLSLPTYGVRRKPPEISNCLPLPNAANIILNTSIYFEVDDESGVDKDTLSVTINSASAIVDGILQPGYDSTSTIIDDGAGGYDVTINPDVDFDYGEEVIIAVTVSDSASTPNSLSYSYSFTCIADTTPPGVSNRNPAADATDIAVNTDVYFEVDDESGVNNSTLNVTVNSIYAIRDGVYQPGYGSGPIVADGAGGYDVTIDPDADFDYGEEVVVAITVSDSASTPNTLTDSYSFTCIADTTPPGVSNQNPAADATNVAVNTDIYFEIDDTQTGVNKDTLNVTINSVNAIVNGVYQPGYGGGPIVADGAGGYDVTIDPGVNFDYGEEVVVAITVSDSASIPNTLIDSYSFTCIADTTPPAVSNQNPADGATNVAVNIDIYFEINDSQTGVNKDTLNVTINSVNAIVNGVYQPGYGGGPIVADGVGGYDVTIDPDVDFDYGEEVVVAITVSDSASTPNTLTDSYSFTCIADTTPPEVSNQNPAADATNVAVNTDIYFEIDDTQTGVNKDSLNVTINSVNAIVNGVYQPGYGGGPIVADGAGGYDVTINPDVDFGYNEVVTITIIAKDNKLPLPNDMPENQYSFTIMPEDNVPPEVSNQNPADGAINVAVNTNVYFEIDDVGEGVNINTLNVTINTDDAVLYGQFQTGYDSTVVDDGAGGYDVTINPDINFNLGDLVAVAITVNDLAIPSNLTALSYSFNIRENIFFDDFEDGWGNWSAENGVWAIGDTTSESELAPYSGNNCAATILGDNYPEDTEPRLVSPSILLPELDAGEDFLLRYWYWFRFGSNDPGGVIQVKYETSPGVWSNWEDIANCGTGAVSRAWASPVWSYGVEYLSGYAGEKIKVGFLLDQGRGSWNAGGVDLGWYIDDVSVISVQTFDLTTGNPYSYDFEEGWNDWGSRSGLWEVGTPTAGPSEAHSGVSCAATVLDGNYSEDTEGCLLSPAVQLPTLTSGEEIYLKFFHWYQFGSNDPGGVIQIISETSPGIWGSWTTLATYNVSSPGWSFANVDLSAYAGEKIIIKFLLDQGRGSWNAGGVDLGWYIDDVSFEVIQP